VHNDRPCAASSDNATFFSVAPRGPRSASVSKIPDLTPTQAPNGQTPGGHTTSSAPNPQMPAPSTRTRTGTSGGQPIISPTHHFPQPISANNADRQSPPSSETSERHDEANAIRANHNPEGPPVPESDKVAIFDGRNDSDFDGAVMPRPVKDASRPAQMPFAKQYHI
jgi:hypothetical protein